MQDLPLGPGERREGGEKREKSAGLKIEKRERRETKKKKKKKHKKSSLSLSLSFIFKI